MEKTEEPKSRARYDRLRDIEIEMQKTWEAEPSEYHEANAPEEYYNKSLAEKN